MNNVEVVINQRLKLQSTETQLREVFNIKDVSNLYTEAKKNFINWDENKQKKFIILLGGKLNFNKTKEFLFTKI